MIIILIIIIIICLFIERESCFENEDFQALTLKIRVYNQSMKPLNTAARYSFVDERENF